MQVLVVGSVHPTPGIGEESITKAAHQLGEALARAGHGLSICSLNPHTVDRHVLEGFLSQPSNSRILLFRPAAQSIEPNDATWLRQQSNGALVVHNIHGPWRVVHLTAIRASDILLALGGDPAGEGTTKNLYSAELMDRPVAVARGLGGASAGEAWQYLSNRYYATSAGVVQALGADLNVAGSEWATNIVRALPRLRSGSRAFRNRLIAAAVCGVTLIALWLIATFYALPMHQVGLHLCVALAAASLAGGALRVVLEGLGAVTTGALHGHPLLFSAAGLLVGFGLVLVAGTASFVMHGDAVNVATPQDMQRISFLLSPLLFTAALFLDEAWRKLSRSAKGLLVEE